MTEHSDPAAVEDPSRYRDLGWWRDETLADDLKRCAREAPDRLALVSHFWETSQEPDVVLTYADLAQRVDRAAAGLLELGVGHGDRVAMQLVNQWQATVLVLACARIGAIVVPFFIATGAADAEYILSASQAKVVVSLDHVRGIEVAKVIDSLRPRVATLTHHIVVGDARPAGSLSYMNDLLGTAWEERHRDLDAYAPGADELFQIIYTSGTTGQPKGVLHSHNTVYAMTRSYTEPMEFGADAVLTSSAIVAGQAGFLFALVAPVLVGATAVLADAYKPADFLDLMERYGVTGTYFTPVVVDPLIAEQRARPRTLQLRRIIAGSSPIPPTMPAEVYEVFGVPLHPLWGMTENGGVTVGRPGDPWDLAVRSDGRPVDGMRIRLVGEDGAEVPPHSSGRLEVRGASQCLGYDHAADVYEAVLHDGWFQTGDVAKPDGSGGIKIIGRVKDMINKGGLHVPSIQVEGVLRTHPQVKDVALVGEEAEPQGELVVAFVVPEGEPPTLEELRQHVRAAGMTLGYEPDRLELIDELPRTETGKVLKRELEQRLTGG